MYSDNLKKIRFELGLSSQKLAERLDVSQGSITQYEGGTRKPNFEFMEKLNTILNINLNWFITSDGEMFNTPQGESIETDFAQRLSRIEAVLKDAGFNLDSNKLRLHE